MNMHNEYAQIGEWLKIARQEKRLSIADIADVLHIKSRYLDALERGEFEGLPGLPYVKGYLKRYADYLALDADEIIRRFDEAANSDNATYFFLPHSFSNSKNIEYLYAFKLTIPALICFMIWAFFIRLDQNAPSIIDYNLNIAALPSSPQTAENHASAASIMFLYRTTADSSVENQQNNHLQKYKTNEQYKPYKTYNNCQKGQRRLYQPCYRNYYPADYSINFTVNPAVNNIVNNTVNSSIMYLLKP